MKQKLMKRERYRVLWHIQSTHRAAFLVLSFVYSDLVSRLHNEHSITIFRANPKIYRKNSFRVYLTSTSVASKRDEGSKIALN